jgi:hypothetical protein
MDAKRRLVDELELPPEGGHDYMGWKKLPQALRREHEKRKERKTFVSRNMAFHV